MAIKCTGVLRWCIKMHKPLGSAMHTVGPVLQQQWQDMATGEASYSDLGVVDESLPDKVESQDHMPIRFQYCRWGETRKIIFSMGVGNTHTFPNSEMNNATTSMSRLSLAIPAMKWRGKIIDKGIKVTRLQ